jgi:hypothetical protein
MVKIFKFEVSNASSSPLSDDEGKDWFKKAQGKLVTAEYIEETINSFIKDKSVQDIKVNNVDEKYHNNARANTVFLVYTIIYNLCMQ